MTSAFDSGWGIHGNGTFNEGPHPTLLSPAITSNAQQSTDCGGRAGALCTLCSLLPGEQEALLWYS